MIKTFLGLFVLAALLGAAGCNGEPTGDTPAPGVKVVGPNDPGPKPVGAAPSQGSGTTSVND